MWEDDSTLQWDVRVVDCTEIKRPKSLPGFAGVVAKGLAAGPIRHERQLILVLPTETYDMDRGALVGVAQGV